MSKRQKRVICGVLTLFIIMCSSCSGNENGTEKTEITTTEETVTTAETTKEVTTTVVTTTKETTTEETSSNEETTTEETTSEEEKKVGYEHCLSTIIHIIPVSFAHNQ
jgi:carbohydrate-binding DOMON domain-containing protein